MKLIQKRSSTRRRKRRIETQSQNRERRQNEKLEEKKRAREKRRRRKRSESVKRWGSTNQPPPLGDSVYRYTTAAAGRLAGLGIVCTYVVPTRRARFLIDLHLLLAKGLALTLENLYAQLATWQG